MFNLWPHTSAEIRAAFQAEDVYGTRGPRRAYVVLSILRISLNSTSVVWLVSCQIHSILSKIWKVWIEFIPTWYNCYSIFFILIHDHSLSVLFQMFIFIRNTTAGAMKIIFLKALFRLFAKRQRWLYILSVIYLCGRAIFYIIDRSRFSAF